MDLEFKTFPFNVKSTSGDNSSFEGLVSAFYNIDSYGEIVDDGAFDDDLEDFMANGFIGGLNHDWDNPIGTPQVGTKVVKDGLHLKGNVIDTSHGMDVRKMLKAGVVKKLSIGFRRMGIMQLEDAEACMAYWEEKGYTPNAQDMARCQYGALVLTRIKLFEGSPVTVPANDMATITQVKAANARALLSCNCGNSVVQTPAEPSVTDTVTDQSSDVRALEQYFRDEGMSVKKAKEAVSKAKTLLRDVVSDDAEPVTATEVPDDTVLIESTDSDDAAVTDEPEVAADDAQVANETLVAGDESVDSQEPIVTLGLPHDVPQLLLRESSVMDIEYLQAKRHVAGLLIARQAQIDDDANHLLSLGLHDRGK